MNQHSAELTSAEGSASRIMEAASKDAQVVMTPVAQDGREASVEGEGSWGVVTATGIISDMPDNNSNGADLGAARQRIRRRSKSNHDAETLRQSFFAEPTGGGDGCPSTDPEQTQPSINSQGSIVLHRPVPVRPVAVRPVALRPAPIRPFVGQPHQQQQQVSLQQEQPIVMHPPSSNTSQISVNQNNWSNVPKHNNISGGRRAMKSAKSLARKYKKPSWYHSVAAQNRLGSIHEDAFLPESDEETDTNETMIEHEVAPSVGMPSISGQHQQHIEAKRALLRALNRTEGDANTPAFQLALQKLLLRYDPSHFDPRRPVPRYAQAVAANQLEGVGIAAGKPAFPGCIGRNGRGKDGGDPMYKLGTMSFDMFCPTQLVVSVQGTFVLIDTVDGRNVQGVKHVPKNLQDDVRFGKSPVRTYDIVTPFTIEPWQPEFGDNSPNKGVEQPIQGVMTTYGFLLPYPTKHRFAVWFTGGSLEVDGNKNEKWFQIFDKEAAPKRTAAECGKLLAAKIFMGASANNGEMDQDGKLSYSLSRPKASYVDLLYLDKTLQVLRASSGTIYVHVRLPGSKAVHESVLSDEPLPAPMDPFLQLDDNERSIHDISIDDDNRVEYQTREGVAFGVGCNVYKPSFTFGEIGTHPLRRAVSESDLYDPFSQDQEITSTSDARLQELEAYAVEAAAGNNNKSCLKKASSYGGLEELGKNIPIATDRKAGVALPKPTCKCSIPKQNLKKEQKRPWIQLKRTLSDPTLLSPWFASSHHSKSDDKTTDSNNTDPDDKSGRLTAPKKAPTPEPKLTKAVSFSCLEIRSYNLCVGDILACSHGAPISLDWTYDPQSERIAVSAYEVGKGSKQRLHAKNALERSWKLRHESGAGMSEIITASAEVERVKHQRKKTVRSVSNRSLMKVEGAIEAVQRKAKRVVHRLRPHHISRRNSPKRGVAGVA